MKRAQCLFAILVLASTLAVRAQSATTRPGAAWEGLTGLYTQPTAEILAPGQWALNYSEIRFDQGNGNTELNDTWYSGTATYVFSRRFEAAIGIRHEIVHTNPIPTPGDITTLDKHPLLLNAKYVITPVQPKKVGIAVGIFDIANQTNKLDDYDTERGIRLFGVGTYQWGSLGLSYDNDGLGAFAGVKLSLTDDIEIIGEYITNPLFVAVQPKPGNKANFNLGLRIYPREIPRLRIDAAAVGDGEFNFGFGISYLIN